jgi:predicted nuclease of restriction endonuclease-like (RecB) superfamily
LSLALVAANMFLIVSKWQVHDNLLVEPLSRNEKFITIKFRMTKSLTTSFESFYERITEILEGARTKVYRTANNEMLQAYWNVGREIVEEELKGKDRAEYGGNLIKTLSDKLSQAFGKGFTKSNLNYMKQFYQTFEKGHALRGELSWTHYRLLVKVDTENVREFYIAEAIDGNWSTRQLERQINSLYYERILMSGKQHRQSVIDEAESTQEKMQPSHFIKDPFVLEFLDVKENEKLAETQLESALIKKLQQFLLELGNGFAFIGRQYRITADNDHYYIDLVFYNYILKCFLLIDLKTEKLVPQDIGQMDFYVRFFEDKIKQPGDNPTIGLILCTDKNKTIMKYSVLSEGKQIFASKYKLYLPNEESLKEEIRRERDLLEREQSLGER